MLPALLALSGLVASVLAMPAISLQERNPLNALHKRCNAYNKGLPTATGTVSSSAAITIKAGVVFDGVLHLEWCAPGSTLKRPPRWLEKVRPRLRCLQRSNGGRRL